MVDRKVVRIGRTGLQQVIKFIST